MTSQQISDQEWRPNLFIAGFAKCGTKELCDYLSQHPNMFLPYEKEPNTFYDLAKYPAYFSGDRTGNTKHRIIGFDDYYKLFSRERNARYRIDGTVSYTFDPKFPRVLKTFSENAKVILLVRNQIHRLASMYFFSFVVHKENDFGGWLEEYLTPYLNTYLYYDKITAYHKEFGDNLRIIETNNLSSEDVHQQLFEYLEVKPIKISVTRKNANLLGPSDSRLYRNVISSLTPIKVGTLRIAHHVGLEDQAFRLWYVIGDVARDLFRRHNKNSNYSEMINLIPHDLSSMLNEDYEKSLEFAIQNRILIRPAC